MSYYEMYTKEFGLSQIDFRTPDVNLTERSVKRLKGETMVKVFFDEKDNKIDITAKSKPELEDSTAMFNINNLLKGKIFSFVKHEYLHDAVSKRF